MKPQKIALIGLDGSGKSANIDIMKTDMDYDKYIFTWVRWKPTLLKPLYLVLGNRVIKSSGNVEGNTHSAEAEKSSDDQIKLRNEYNKKAGLKKRIFKNSIVRSVWMGLAIFDYFLQFYAKTLVNILKKSNMIFDRFYLDLFVDQGINFGFSPERIGEEIHKHQWMFPKMDQIIYIRVSPEICYNRKDDIPNMEYLLKRYDIYEHLAKENGWIVIDGEQPLNIVNDSIKQKILG